MCLTFYSYIDNGILLSRNVDLKRKVKFKKRKPHRTQIREVLIGRTFADFKGAHTDELDFREVDTVKSAHESTKCILTLYFPQTQLLIDRLVNLCAESAVKL